MSRAISPAAFPLPRLQCSKLRCSSRTRSSRMAKSIPSTRSSRASRPPDSNLPMKTIPARQTSASPANLAPYSGSPRAIRMSSAAGGFGARRIICASPPPMRCPSRSVSVPRNRMSVRRARSPRRYESRIALCATLFLTAAVVAGCGYTVAGTATHIPPDVHTIAVLPLVNKTTTYRIEQRMTNAVTREFLERTKYRIVSTASDVTYDYTSGRATTMLVTVTMKVRLEDRDHKVLYENDNYVFREPYEISTDVNSFFQEEGPALDRMSQDFASRLVADVLENF